MIETRLTRQFGLSVPVVLAPMARVAGGRLAAAVSRAGGLGLIGGGYCDAAWIAEQMDLLRDHAGRAPFGVGLITWALDAVPEVLGQVLAQGPQAVFLSFGDPRPHADAIHAAGARLICQVQDMTGARQALAAGADVIVAQGAEAGGHGAGHGRGRATMTLVPEVVDLVAAFRSSLVDVARGLDWPAPYDLRGMRNAFSAQWEGRLEALAADPAARAAWAEAAANGDAGIAAPIVGEGIGLIRDAPGAAQIMARMAQEAAQRLGHGARPVGT